MTDNDMQSLVQSSMKIATDQILAGDEVIRTFFCQSKNGDKHMVIVPAHGYDEDTKLLTYLKLMFCVLDVQAYCMLSEVWMATGTTAMDVPPSERPDREEALMAICVRRFKDDQGKHHLDIKTARAMITRDPTKVGPVIWDEADRVEGRMAALLPPPDMPPCPDVEGAMKALERMAREFGVTGMPIANPMVKPDGVSVH